MGNSRLALTCRLMQVGAKALTPTNRAFANADTPVFYGPVSMYNINQPIDNHPAIRLLAEKAKPEAIHDSSFRQYAAKCSEDTRVSIRRDIVKWRGNPNRQSRLRWYMGPPAVGKTAIAQSVAEELERIGLLGGSFFFSRPGQINDPDSVIPTLVYQLALISNRYRKIITKLLVHDPLLLTKNRAIQFKKLIVEPFQMIMSSDSAAVDNPLLIILDGLDECRGGGAQCELVQLILDHIQQFQHFPLVWLLLSRSEWHLKTLVSDVDFPTLFKKREIYIDDEEAIADARRLLKGELTKVREQYPYLHLDWPTKEDIDRLCKIASGHLGYVSFLARFIRDKEVADPERQFLICIRVASGLGVDQGTCINPLEALDRLYHRVLSDVSTNVLPTAMKVFGAIHCPGSKHFTCRELASFLFLTEGQLYQTLRGLHAVVYVPPLSESNSRRLRFFHTSFSDFIEDHIRAGKFHLSRKTMFYDMIVQYLRWIDRHGDELSTGNVDLILNWKLNAGLTLTSLI
ncbi:hypothetical protein NP233_g4647 [Leucocoprinus birnbaumii]|uniref:Nephrocystin 3-like N-terminal domain-containing protein n=1 Tax=Leucocoprinus birnbaumii TaxID=56174 RepID=A0AAD5W0R6_9AGAR|nr:hypothetical protein NP233_g4647 [Leucocoprinus birnbaumii]